MGTAIRPSLAALSRYKVLPPDPEDIDRLIQIQRAQNARDTWDENLAGNLVGMAEGLVGTDTFSSVPSLRGSRDTGRFLGEALGNLPTEGLKSKIGPMMGVAFGVGRQGGIAHQRMQGAKNVERVLQEGLEQRSLGMRPPVLDEQGNRTGEFFPNQLLNDPTMSALSIAQQRWPRLVGHLSDIAQVDAFTKLQNPLGRTIGSVSGSILRDPKAYKVMRLGLDPEYSTPNTVGHELKHVKDRLLDPKFNEKYQADKLKVGYKNMKQETSANAMGHRFQEIVDEIENLGGRARDVKGRNISVPKLRTAYTGEETAPFVHPDDAEVDYQLKRGKTLEEAYAITAEKIAEKEASELKWAETQRKWDELKKRLGIK